MVTVTVTVTVPGLLARFTGGRRTAEIRADSVEEAIDKLVESYPAIEPHLFDGDGRPRPHLRLFHDGTGIEWRTGATAQVADGDELVVLQAVSGG